MSPKRAFSVTLAITAVAIVTAGILAGPGVAQTDQGKRKPEKVEDACDLVELRGDTEVECVATDVEAWYHGEAAGAGGIAPVTGLPDFDPYAEHTLHVGFKQGAEDARTYLTFKEATVSLDSIPAGGELILVLDPDQSAEATKDIDLRACPVPQPPEQDRQGSADTPPEVDCSLDSKAEYVKKPRPFYRIDLGPIVDYLTAGAGVALLPGPKAKEESQTWHVSLYGQKNDADNAVPIRAALTFETVSGTDPLPPVTDTTGGSTAIDLGSGSSSGSVGGISLGDAPADQDPVDIGDTGDATEPVEALPPSQAAGEIHVPRYPAIYYLPLLLLVGSAFLSFAFTRKIDVAKPGTDGTSDS